MDERATPSGALVQHNGAPVPAASSWLTQDRGEGMQVEQDVVDGLRMEVAGLKS